MLIQLSHSLIHVVRVAARQMNAILCIDVLTPTLAFGVIIKSKDSKARVNVVAHRKSKNETNAS